MGAVKRARSPWTWLLLMGAGVLGALALAAGIVVYETAPARRVVMDYFAKLRAHDASAVDLESFDGDLAETREAKSAITRATAFTIPMWGELDDGSHCLNGHVELDGRWQPIAILVGYGGARIRAVSLRGDCTCSGTDQQSCRIEPAGR